MEIVGFGPMDFEEFGFWTGLIDHAIPFPTAQHALIQRPGSTPVFGTPIINERRIPVQIGWDGGGGFGSTNDAWAGLMAALQPLNMTPRELRARRDDGTIVALTAVVEVPAFVGDDVNIIHVTFITVDLEWIALSEVLQTTTFSDPGDQAFLLSTALLGADPGRIMLSPTTQRDIPIFNGTFDVDTAGWTLGGFPPNSSGTIGRSTVSPHTGAGHLRITFVTNTTAGSKSVVAMTDYIPVRPGDLVTATLWSRISAANLRGDLILAWYDAAKVFLSAPTDNGGATLSTWEQQVLADQVAPVGAAYFRVQARGVSLVSGAVGNIDFDDITIGIDPGMQYGAKWQRSMTLLNDGPNVLAQFPIQLPFGSTTALVSGGKALANGDDFRVTVDGFEIPRNLRQWNTATTGVRVIIPHLEPGDSITFDFLYGNPAMGAPPTLEYPIQPAFGHLTNGNDSIEFATDDIQPNAGRGLWYLSALTTEPEIDQTVPGAWQFVTTKSAAEDFNQARSTEYVDTNTYYRATFQARRSRAGAINPQNNRNADGVVYHSPLPIESITFGYQYRNDNEGVDGTPPVGLFVVLGRVGTEAWAPIHTRSTVQHGSWATISSTAYAPAAPVTDIALAVWPFNQVAVRAGVVTGREINVFVDTNITLAIDDSALVFGALSPEVEVYELVERIITYEDGTNRVARMVLLGAEAGGRLTIPLGNTLVVDGLFRTVEEWNAAADTFIRTIPPPAYRVLQEVNLDAGFETLAVASDVWPNPTPPTNVIPNSSFTLNVDGWSRRFASPGLTTTGPTHETTVVQTAPGSLKTVISASTGAIGTSVIEQLTAKLAINGQFVVTASAHSRTNDDELAPRLGIAFYDGDDVLIEEVFEEVYLPIADAWRRRIVAVGVPDRAITYQPLLQSYTRVANAIGTVYWDDVAAGGAEIVLRHRPDDEPGTMVLSYASYPSFL